MRLAVAIVAVALSWPGRVLASDCAPYRLDWSFRTASPVSPPVAVDAEGRVTVATQEGYLHGLGADGGLRWSYAVSGGLPHGVTSDESGQVYAASGDDTVVSLAATGEPRWVFHSPVHADSALFVGPRHAAHFVSGRALHAVSSRAGLLWGVALGGRPTGAPLLGPDGATWLATDQGVVHSIRTPFLSNQWSVAQGPIVLLAVSQRVVLVDAVDRVVAVDRSGERRWSVASVRFASVDRTPGSDLALLVRPGALDFRHQDDGRLVRSVAFSSSLSAAPLLVSGTAFLPVADGSVAIVESQGDTRRCALSGSALAAPLLSGRRVIVASASGVAALSLPEARP